MNKEIACKQSVLMAIIMLLNIKKNPEHLIRQNCESLLMKKSNFSEDELYPSPYFIINTVVVY